MAWTTPGTAVAGDVLTAAFWNSNVRDNLAELANLADGTTWETWTPASRTGLTVGNGTETARYVRVGRLVAISYLFTFGSTSAITGDVNINLPFNNARTHPFACLLTDSGTLDYWGACLVANNNLAIRACNSAGTYLSQAALSSTIPFTWGTNDVIAIAGVYETAT